MKSCGIATSVGNKQLCYLNQGWHINSFQRLDANSKSLGIPQGMKFSLKAYIFIKSTHGGRVLVTYKMKNMHPNEYLRVLINGHLQFSSNKDTNSVEEYNLEPANESVDGFTYFESGLIPYGNNSIEISVLSEFSDFQPEFTSQAHVEIKRISFLGTTNGGASDCIAVPEGWFAPALSTLPSQCPPGETPDATKSKCEKCAPGFYNPVKGGSCLKCPEHTHSSVDSTSCVPFDIISSQELLYPVHQLIRPDLFCINAKNKHLCD